MFNHALKRKFWKPVVDNKQLVSAFCRRLSSTNEELIERTATIEAQNVTVSEALSLNPEQHTRIGVKGWVQRVAEHKDVVFISLSDGVCPKPLQVVIPEKLVERYSKPKFGASVYFEGIVKESPGPRQPAELHCDHLDIIGDSDTALYPMSNTKLDWVTLRQLQHHFRLRVPKYAALMRIRSALTQAVHELMKSEKFFHVSTPIITSIDAEGAGKSPLCNEKDTFFDADAHLTVSGQLHLEAAIGGLSRVYTLSPAFRAENSLTSRHVCEFAMLEVEEAFVESVDSLMDRVEQLCKSMANHVEKECPTDINKIIDKKEDKHIFRKIKEMKFIRMTYDEAVELINKSQNITELKYGEDIGAYHEKVLLNYFDWIPVFITHFPAKMKPFYMKRENDKALCFDLICKHGGEVCGGSLREDNYDVLKERIDQFENPEAFKWYLELRQCGSVPHGGFGIGFDRYIQSITGITNIKDVIPFPRWSHHCAL